MSKTLDIAHLSDFKYFRIPTDKELELLHDDLDRQIKIASKGVKFIRVLAILATILGIIVSIYYISIRDISSNDKLFSLIFEILTIMFIPTTFIVATIIFSFDYKVYREFYNNRYTVVKTTVAEVIHHIDAPDSMRLSTELGEFYESFEIPSYDINRYKEGTIVYLVKFSLNRTNRYKFVAIKETNNE